MAIQLIGFGQTESAILILYYKKLGSKLQHFRIEIGTFAKLARNNYGSFCLVEHIRGDTVLE